MKDRVEIGMAADENYSLGMFVTALSIAVSASHSVTLSFSFLDGGIPDDTYNAFLLKLKRMHPSVECRRFKVDEQDFSDFHEYHGNRMAYARFLLVYLLPEVKHLIYCDVDFLWMRDIARLWEARDDSIVLQAVRDPLVERTKIPEWYKQRGYPFPWGRYICSGLLLMNLEALRKRNFISVAYEFLRKNPDTPCADQDAFVVLLEPETKLLDDDWMRFTSTLSATDFSRELVYHFTYEWPWKPTTLLQSLKDVRMLWCFFAEEHGIMTIPVKVKFLYYITRTPIIRSLFCWVLWLVGKPVHARYIKQNCSWRVKLPPCNKSV